MGNNASPTLLAGMEWNELVAGTVSKVNFLQHEAHQS